MTTTAAPSSLDELLGTVAADIAGANAVAMIGLGDRLGLYRALNTGPATAAELAGRTGCHPRLVAEWLAQQAAARYVTRDGDSYRMSPEQASVFADESSPAFLAGGTAVATAISLDHQLIERAFRGDGSLDWGEHHPLLFTGVDRFFRPGYRAALTSTWLPALDGVVDKLTIGARVADVGCGHGSALEILAQHYPASSFVGVDSHGPSAHTARARVDESGLSDRVTICEATAAEYDGGPYDLVCFLDSLHDMGDPAAVVAHTRSQLADDGTVLLVEPMAAEHSDDEVGNMISKMYYAGSVALCLPNALSQGEHGLGNQVPDHVWRDIFLGNGFSSFTRATETPFNRVFEARA